MISEIASDWPAGWNGPSRDQWHEWNQSHGAMILTACVIMQSPNDKIVELMTNYAPQMASRIKWSGPSMSQRSSSLPCKAYWRAQARAFVSELHSPGTMGSASVGPPLIGNARSSFWEINSVTAGLLTLAASGHRTSKNHESAPRDLLLRSRDRRRLLSRLRCCR